MKLIEQLSEEISEEIHDAGCYIKNALKLKDDYPELSKLYYRLSEEEMEHMKELHSAVSDLIADYRSRSGEPPESMQAVYDYLHEKQIEKATNVKSMMELYRK